MFVVGTPSEKPNTHSEVEVLFVMEGAVNVQVEQKSTFLKADDILVVNSNKKFFYAYWIK